MGNMVSTLKELVRLEKLRGGCRELPGRAIPLEHNINNCCATGHIVKLFPGVIGARKICDSSGVCLTIPPSLRPGQKGNGTMSIPSCSFRGHGRDALRQTYSTWPALVRRGPLAALNFAEAPGGCTGLCPQTGHCTQRIERSRRVAGYCRPKGDGQTRLFSARTRGMRRALPSPRCQCPNGGRKDQSIERRMNQHVRTKKHPGCTGFL
jgi:hypothetical protein